MIVDVYHQQQGKCFCPEADSTEADSSQYQNSFPGSTNDCVSARRTSGLTVGWIASNYQHRLQPDVSINPHREDLGL